MEKYVAITTTNAQQNGWHEVASGTNKAEVQAQAERQIAGNQWDKPKDIYTQTELANLTVVSATVAKRTYKVDPDQIDTSSW